MTKILDNTVVVGGRDDVDLDWSVLAKPDVVPEMTYNVFSGTLNFNLNLNL